MILDALKCRFYRLPNHKRATTNRTTPPRRLSIIDQMKSMLHQYEASLVTPNNQDCLGTRGKQNHALFQLIVANNPRSLITEDKWDSLPILYAIWSGAPAEIIQYLIDTQKSAFAHHILDWDKMIATSCRTGVSKDTVQLLLGIHQTYFSEQNVN